MKRFVFGVSPFFIILCLFILILFHSCYRRFERVGDLQPLIPDLTSSNLYSEEECGLFSDTLPEGSIVSTKVHRVIDGDTFSVNPSICRRYGIELKGTKNECFVRLLGINTPEKVRTSRREGEEMSIEAMVYLEKLVEKRTVFLLLSGRIDNYDRLLVVKTFLPIRLEGWEKERYLDVHSALVKSGFAHVFVFTVDEEALRQEYLECQAVAKRFGRGIWGTRRYRGDFHITSFHANGSQSDNPIDDCTLEDEPPNCEYFRIANITDRELDLKFYSVRNCETKETIPLPSIRVPPGVMVKIYSGKGKNQTEFEKGELWVYLGRDSQFWDNDGAEVIILGPNGIEDHVSSSKDFSCVR